MKKIALLIAFALMGFTLQAQSYKLVIASDIPADAVTVLHQRFTQMLEAGGLSVADDGAVLEIKAADISSMVVNPNQNQVMLDIALVAKTGEVSETFNIKGVGQGEADAWLRAVKQILPRSKAASQFLEKLK